MSLTKLTITAYTSVDYSTKVGMADFMAQINPETWKEDYSVKYSKSSTQGGLATQLRFYNIDSGNLSLSLEFDGTGLISTTPSSLVGVSVTQQLENFKNLALNPNGDTHQPNYLMVVWGQFSYKGLLTNLQVEYTLISPSGEPLRAKAIATIQASESLSTANKEAGVNSPDMTHRATVVAGDRLSKMCFDIYNDPSYYIGVAKNNDLDQVRSLKNGIVLNFNPLEK
jgi:hypothetical protein